MPQITVQSVRDGDEWVVPLNPAEIENPMVPWTFDSATRTMMTKLATAEAVREIVGEINEVGLNAEGYAVARDMAFARVHLAGRSYTCGSETVENLTTDQIDAIPPDVLGHYVYRAQGGGVLKPKGLSSADGLDDGH